MLMLTLMLMLMAAQKNKVEGASAFLNLIVRSDTHQTSLSVVVLVVAAAASEGVVVVAECLVLKRLARQTC